MTALTNGAPTFGLGEHCSANHAHIASCSYTVDRKTLTDRSQVIHQTLDIKIPGVTDKSDKTDVMSSVTVHFVAGKIENEIVKKMSIHLISPTADASWSSSDGVDRYVGVLHNFDLYEGFLSIDVGSYAMDAAISFDNGETWTYCGPNGIIDDYETYQAAQRNRVDVAYETSTCGDGVISGSEVCDGNKFIEDALVCSNPAQVVLDRSQLKCNACDVLSTSEACGNP